MNGKEKGEKVKKEKRGNVKDSLQIQVEACTVLQTQIKDYKLQLQSYFVM
jgi:hypothetical protein